MNLIIDVGNSFIKVAVFKADKVVEVAQTTESDFLKKISNIFENHPSIAKIMVSSVGKLSDAYIEGLSVFAPVLILNKNSKLPFKNEYATPNTLGVDRIALVAAAFYAYPQKNCLVIDAGTCITYDFLDEKGVYKGGAISPGIRMRYKAMHAFTAKLPLIDSFGLENFIGNSTETCMISGVINGTVNEIEATILQYQRKFKDLTVILTGGDSHFLSKRLKSSIFAHPNFLMEGVNYILELNKH
ncbi:pantothenate kinase, type III [Galbibacter orientalis DSM 19592]|uniref:Type III pantothenate kinase n=1 Tax=Galbibacter orientalis DSM 19592 TaxID=926559 RepID=I3C2V8_9FLAO|nr:type III pantothenate kinase [Galbibacter orientalis]EIJ37951.1 pantothenate kinase, type III [Galbibacter orientalis DSM 19592]